ncbi:sigma factor binding protein 1, chloroplastic-like [Curcuma longa]|uniref:sigma factor binding protein 1, chloroplastic-like n=1 Tax=Curcuma longa TaxID=136217 RepID=UPI003D9EBFFA
MKAKITKNRRRGIKVVYISNPMRVTTTAASFRALVQQLTGADSTVAADMANSASSFVDVVDYNGVVHGHPPPPAADSSFHSVVGQPMLLSDQMWSGTAPVVEEETPWEVYYGSLRRWILDD